MSVSIRNSLALGGVALVALACLALLEHPASGEILGGANPSNPAEDLCASGQQQSPVDLAGAVPASAGLPVMKWKPAHGGMVINTGQTIEVDVEGAGGVTIEGISYGLKQVHFHHPSEHTIDGKHFAMEAHLVHAAADGKLAVIGVLFEEGAANPALDPVWATAPGREGKAAVAFQIDPAKLVGAGTSAYRYEGSLTTAPCSETVTWTVLAQPRTASHSQIAAFAAMFPNNARPVQPLNRRYVLKTGD
jgi:carbonic anhydrase